MFNPQMLMNMMVGQTPIEDISGLGEAMAANPAIQGPAATPVTPGSTGIMPGGFSNPPGSNQNSLLSPTDKFMQMLALVGSLWGSEAGTEALKGFANLQQNRMNTQLMGQKGGEQSLPFPGSQQQAVQPSSLYQDR